MLRVDVKPEMLRWACDRAGLDVGVLTTRIPQLAAWEQGTTKPTLRQIERFAKAVCVPVGFLFLQRPPADEAVPIPDLRTTGNARITRPSPDLLETIYMCQQRQEWYHEFARSIGESALSFVGSVHRNADIVQVANEIRTTLDVRIEARGQMHTWQEALRHLIAQADNAGILVMVNGVVGNNTHRKLDVAEFRGFALTDDLAPVVFINGSDTKSGQMFTLAHELAHIWLGESGVSDVEPTSKPTNHVEAWCNQVAAETLVPLEALRNEYRANGDLFLEMARLARKFKVSTLVILRRIHDAGHLSRDDLWAAYTTELQRLMDMPRGDGGHFYHTQAARVSKRFARALVTSTLEGQTLHRDAFRLLGFAKYTTFRELGDRLGVV